MSPHARPLVFLAHEKKKNTDREHVEDAVAPQIIQLLTGVTEEQLRPLGGVVFRDPVSERDLPRSES
jgi:hypothetical protein